jgi:glutamate--cysteine ligase
MIQTREDFEKFVCEHWIEINRYLDDWSGELSIPFYSSVDIRESSDKFAPVDHNLYPAGFNNICRVDLEACLGPLKKVLNRMGNTNKVVGILPESHTKNAFYLDHLFTLQQLIQDCGYQVKIFSIDPNLFPDNAKTVTLQSASKFELRIERAEAQNGYFLLHDKTQIDIVILNNDQSVPLPVDWSKIVSPVSPTPMLGWYRRQKNCYFNCYHTVLEKFCSHFDISMDLLQAKHSSVCDVDFESKDGLEKLASTVDNMKTTLQQQGNPSPKIFIKASKGTYGMGIMVVESGKEVLEMNRKTRNKMDVGKNSIKFTDVLVQEGVETALKYKDKPAEVTIYLIDGKSIGGFLRSNPERGTNDNLNSRGMILTKFCISEIRENHDHKCKEAVYSIVARLATIANAFENKKMTQEKSNDQGCCS